MKFSFFSFFFFSKSSVCIIHSWFHLSFCDAVLFCIHKLSITRISGGKTCSLKAVICYTIMTTLFRRFWLKTGQMARLRSNVCCEKFACDRINDILFSLEHVIKTGEEKTSGKRQVYAMHKFNRTKCLQERLVENRILAFMLLQAFFFFFYTKQRKPAMKCVCELYGFWSHNMQVYTYKLCFSPWLLKEQSSQCDLLKVDRKYQV